MFVYSYDPLNYSGLNVDIIANWAKYEGHCCVMYYILDLVAWRLLYITYTSLKFTSEIVIFIQDGKSKGAWTLCGNSEASDCLNNIDILVWHLQW